MSRLSLTFACGVYDRTEALRTGDVGVEGIDLNFLAIEAPREIFDRMGGHQEFDVAEFSSSEFISRLARGGCPFVAIPVFPSRVFRHGYIYVNRKSAIRTPQDLAGKTVGEFATYGHDAGVWPKGILSDDYGVTPGQCRWIVGGNDWPMAPLDFIPFLHPADVDVTPAPEGKPLGTMLEAGEIDALISLTCRMVFTMVRIASAVPRLDS